MAGFSFAGQPCAAASATTDAFVSEATATVHVLLTSSARAAERSDHGRIRAFAQSELRTQAIVEHALADWRRTEAQAKETAAAEPTIDHLGPIFGLSRLPIDGPSIAIGPPNGSGPELERLDQASAFDVGAAYIAVQSPALRRLIAAYQSYILNGDDTVLRALAVRELSGLEALAARLKRL